MTIETSGQRETPSPSRTSRRNAVLWALLAALCTILAALGLGSVGPWYITLGSIGLAVASGLSVNRAERSLHSRTGLPRALAGVVFGVILMVMFSSADNQLLFIAACVGTLMAVILALVAFAAFRRTSAPSSSS